MVLLTRLAKQVYRRSSERLLGMHLRLLMALSYLRDNERCPQQQLAEALCMDANNVVLVLNELESPGWITRRRDPADRRRHIVELTAAGRRALTRAERALEALEDDVLAAHDEEQRAVLWQLLTRALYGAEGPGAEASAREAGYSATTASIST
jgi:DNA-binding MarR family transcriptional regulator